MVGDGLVSNGTHNNPGVCFQSARVLVGLFLLDLVVVLLLVLLWFEASGLGMLDLRFGRGVRHLGLVRQGVSAVVCSDFSLLTRLRRWACRATLTHAKGGALDLASKVEPKLR